MPNDLFAQHKSDYSGAPPDAAARSSDEIRECLAKIQSSDPFVRSLRIQRLLEFLVESVLTGRQDRLKEAVIGIEVFDRAAGYDCKVDPVVRVEMRRLRSKLNEYYLDEGKTDEIVIRLEKGVYVPSLLKRERDLVPYSLPATTPDVIASSPEVALTAVDVQNPAELPRPRGPKRARFVWIIAVSAVSLATVILALALSRWSKTSNLPGRLFPLTGNAGLEMSPNFSPDGKQVAYSWDGNRRNFDIYVKPVEGGETRRLTDNAAHDIHPSWSPDGRQIAFLRVFPDRSELLVIPSVSGVETVIGRVATPVNRWHPEEPEGDGAAGPVWSPDGSYLLIASYVGQGTAVGIVKVGINGGQSALTTPPLGSSDVSPSISPSGAFVAFTRNWSSGSSDLYIVPSRGGNAVRLTFDSRDIQGLAWLDDDNLIFSSNRGGSFRLWQMSRLGGEARSVAAGGARPQWPAISKDGHWLAFVELVNDASIWRVHLKGDGSSDRLEPFISSAGWDHSPAYSPDGKKIAFVSDRSGSWQIWLSDSDGAGLKQLTDFKGSMLGTPRWSADSRRIVFDGQLEGRSAIWLIDRDGSNLHRLNNSAAQEYLPSWSRDGQWVYFCSLRDGHDRLWKQKPDSGQAIELTRDLFFDAVEDPNGQVIYMQRAHGSIWQMPVQGGTPQPIPELAGINPARYWTLAGDTLYFVRQEQPPRQLTSFNLVTRKFQTLGSIPSELIAGTPGLCVDPGRQWLFFVQKYQRRSSIMLQER